MTRKIAFSALLFAALLFLGTRPQFGQQASSATRYLELYLTPHGFAVSTVRVPTGPLKIVVVNRAGLSQMHLRLEAANKAGAPALADDVAVWSERQSWAQTVDFATGEYVLRETTRKTSMCAIVVADK